MHERSPTPVDAGGLVVAASALIVVVGALLGWFTVPVAGTIGAIAGVDLFEFGSPVFNGLVTTMLATAATFVAIFLSAREAANVATAVAGVAIELIAAAFLIVPDAALGPAIEVTSDVPLSSTGLGVYVTLVGGLGILLGSVVSYRR